MGLFFPYIYTKKYKHPMYDVTITADFAEIADLQWNLGNILFLFFFFFVRKKVLNIEFRLFSHIKMSK